MVVFFSLAPFLIDFNKASLSFALLLGIFNNGGGGAAGAMGGGGGGAGIMNYLDKKHSFVIKTLLASLLIYHAKVQRDKWNEKNC